MQNIYTFSQTEQQGVDWVRAHDDEIYESNGDMCSHFCVTTLAYLKTLKDLVTLVLIPGCGNNTDWSEVYSYCNRKNIQLVNADEYLWRRRVAKEKLCVYAGNYHQAQNWFYENATKIGGTFNNRIRVITDVDQLIGYRAGQPLILVGSCNERSDYHQVIEAARARRFNIIGSQLFLGDHMATLKIETATELENGRCYAEAINVTEVFRLADTPAPHYYMRTQPVSYMMNSTLIADKVNRGCILATNLHTGVAWFIEPKKVCVRTKSAKMVVKE